MMPDEILNNETETVTEGSAMLAAVKTAMHISGDDMDGALAADIAAAVMDMQRVGVDASESSTEPLIIKCVELWCKASIDYLARGAQFLSCYKALRDSMSLCADYQPAPEVEKSAMLAAVKTAMHISGDDMDGALAADIAAAVMDMQRVGVAASTDSTAPLVIKCVELFCKASIDYLGRGAQFLSCYRALRDSMSLCADYQPAPEVDGNGI